MAAIIYEAYGSREASYEQGANSKLLLYNVIGEPDADTAAQLVESTAPLTVPSAAGGSLVQRRIRCRQTGYQSWLGEVDYLDPISPFMTPKPVTWEVRYGIDYEVSGETVNIQATAANKVTAYPSGLARDFSGAINV